MAKRCEYEVWGEHLLEEGKRPSYPVRFPGTQAGLKQARSKARSFVKGGYAWGAVEKSCKGEDARIVYECLREGGKIRCRKIAKDPWDIRWD